MSCDNIRCSTLNPMSTKFVHDRTSKPALIYLENSSVNVHATKHQCPHQNVGEKVLEDERRQHLGLLQEVLRLRPRLCEHVVEAEDAGDEEVEEEAVETCEAQNAGADPAENGERGAGEVERLVVLHDVPHVQRLRVRRGRGGADHRYEVVRSGVVLPFFQIILRI